jgi:signal transduction histidine kinase
MRISTTWSYKLIYYLTAGLLYGAALLRSIIAYQGSPALNQVLGLLAVALMLFIIERYFSRKWSTTFYLYLILQIAVIVTLLFMPRPSDYFAMLFAILAMQVMQHHELKWGAIWIALFAPLMFVPIMRNYDFSKAIAFTLVYTAMSIFLAAYSLATRRAQQERSRAQELAVELQEANSKLGFYVEQLERLALSTERNRLARELHDSVTQTVFSMSLSIKSALMVIERDSSQVASHLDRFYHLAQNAVSEMQTLILELHPEKLEEVKLTDALHRYLRDGTLPETLSVELAVEGNQTLEPKEAQSLLRIIQEAINNIIKHAETNQAQIRLHLVEPLWIEISDHGRGFDLDHAKNSKRVGLASMTERAQEIGWQLEIQTSPGDGTSVRVKKDSPGKG